MRIRAADRDRDAASCAAIYAPFVRDTPISLEERVPSAQEIAERIETVSRTHAWLVAEDETGVIGYAYATRHRERASYRWAADVAVYVAPHRHRTGAGRALYQTLLARLADHGYRIACAGITLPNQASVGLHEALGFQPVGVYKKIGWKLGAWHDVGWWQLQLASPGITSPDIGSPGITSPDINDHDPPREPGPPA
jgi:L-amino acid N-acyltransferase YncA